MLRRRNTSGCSARARWSRPARASSARAASRSRAADGATRGEDLQTAEAALASTAAKIAHLDAQIVQTQATQRAEEARLGYTRIFAPMAGTVVSMEAREGQTLNATYQTPNILRIADLSAMTVWTEVSEADVRRVRAGLPVYFTTLDGLDGAAPRRWTATVRQVLPAPPVPEGQTGTKASGGSAPGAAKAVVYTVLFDVDNTDGELMPRMTAQVGFVTAQARGVIVVPLAALAAVEGGQGGYTARVLDTSGKPVVRPVRVGIRSRHLAEVREGLAEGDRLVVAEKPVEGLRWIPW